MNAMILTIVSNKQLCQSRLRFWGILLSLLPLSSFSLSKKDLFVQYHDIGVNSYLCQDFRCVTPGPILHICQFWYTTALFKNVKVHQKVCQFLSKKNQNWPTWTKFRILYAKKVHQLEKKYTTDSSGGSD